MANPLVDQERYQFLKARTKVRKVLLPQWPRESKELDLVQVDVKWVLFSTLNHRTKAEQMRAIQLAKNPSLFTADPSGEAAQTAQYNILKAQDGFDVLKANLKERGQQEPAIITCDGILINGNRRSAALKSLYLDDTYLKAQYVNCLVLPDDATPDELVDLEAELQVSKDFKEDYSWVNEAWLIEELYEREGRDFARVAKKMHRDVTDVRSQFEKLQQLHQLVELSNGARLHIDFKDNESAFDELNKHIKNKPKPEQDSVRSTYFLGTLAGSNYRTLRNLRRADASELVLHEMEKDSAFQPFMETVRAATTPSGAVDPLDDLLGAPDEGNRLTAVLSFLADKKKEQVIPLVGGGSIQVDQLFGSIQAAINAAASEASEDKKDQDAVTKPVARLKAAIKELEAAAASLPRAQQYGEWNSAEFVELATRAETLAHQLTQTP
ncbi:ParB N-terminal domain-containing protein [Asticcacaulis sp.]|jgi:hypothetical protein|uniref:ParB N-terminal domain-containing protein n=1 Tax=Asticcacaulis sp. TaxID=1872648 RepID=UPI003F7C050F